MSTRGPRLNAPSRRPGLARDHAANREALRADRERVADRDVRAAPAAPAAPARRSPPAARGDTARRRRASACRRTGSPASTARSSTIRARPSARSAGRTIVASSTERDALGAGRLAAARRSSPRSSGVHRLVARDEDVGGDQRPRLAGEHVAHALDHRAQRDDRADADGDADEEEQQAPPRRAHLAHRHAQDEPHRAGSDRRRGRVGHRPAVAQRRAARRPSRRARRRASRAPACVRRAADLQQQLHDVAAVGAVEIAGRLVGQHRSADRWPARARCATRCCSPPDSCDG